MPVTKDQAQQIATLAIAARPHGARRWDAAGVMAAIGKVAHLELAEVMIAAGRAARDRDLETPGAIGNPSAPCWIERPIERAVPVKTTPAERCGICARVRSVCESSPRFADDDHRFEPDFKTKRDGDTVAPIVEALKGEIVPTAPPPDHKGLDAFLPAERDPRATAAREAINAEITPAADREQTHETTGADA